MWQLISIFDRAILRLLLVVALLRPLKGFRETAEAICAPVGPEGEDCLQLSAVTMTHKKVTVLLHFRSTPVSPKDPSDSFSEAPGLAVCRKGW